METYVMNFLLIIGIVAFASLIGNICRRRREQQENQNLFK